MVGGADGDHCANLTPTHVTSYKTRFWVNELELLKHMIAHICFRLIHRINFEFALDDSFEILPGSMDFNAAMDLTIFGKRMFQPLKFSIINPLESLLRGTDSAVSWFKDNTNPKDRTGTEKTYYDKPSPYSDFDFSGEDSWKIPWNSLEIKFPWKCRQEHVDISDTDKFQSSGPNAGEMADI